MPRSPAGKVRRGGEPGARGVRVWRGYSTLRNPETRSKQVEKKKFKTLSFRGRRSRPGRRQSGLGCAWEPRLHRPPYPRISSALCSRLRTSRNTRASAAAAAIRTLSRELWRPGHRGRKAAARAARAGTAAAAAAAARASRTRSAGARQPTAPPAGRRARSREDSIRERERFQSRPLGQSLEKAGRGEAKLFSHSAS